MYVRTSCTEGNQLLTPNLASFQDSLKTYTRLQKHVQRKTHKMYLEDRELNGLMDVDPHLSVSRISDALQNVLSSYHPLANQEKKAFLRPLQQVFPNYDKDLFVKGKMKKARSMVNSLCTFVHNIRTH